MIRGFGLYWVWDDLHEEDWFVVAVSTDDAIMYMLDAAELDGGSVDAEWIADVPPGLGSVTIRGAIPGWATDLAIEACGGKIIGDPVRTVTIDGRVFVEGALESSIEAARHRRPPGH